MTDTVSLAAPRRECDPSATTVDLFGNGSRPDGTPDGTPDESADRPRPAAPAARERHLVARVTLVVVRRGTDGGPT